ncbi:hypothetical protein BJ322DRAFT_1024260 [Thelephora terrestris]|uniref:Uncharacterized protein n=1 Tax=Thelephora terrestris TaxID=56493 RepID=A0A9P6H5T5_9AGAM|nr:hypothetical protein BJ322DRAFT_1024260 [Thelephora terrestris]
MHEPSSNSSSKRWRPSVRRLTWCLVLGNYTLASEISVEPFLWNYLSHNTSPSARPPGSVRNSGPERENPVCDAHSDCHCPREPGLICESFLGCNYAVFSTPLVDMDGNKSLDFRELNYDTEEVMDITGGLEHTNTLIYGGSSRPRGLLESRTLASSSTESTGRPTYLDTFETGRDIFLRACIGLGARPWAGGGRLAVGAVASAPSTNGVWEFLQIICLWAWSLAAAEEHAFSPAAETAVNVNEICWNIFGFSLLENAFVRFGTCYPRVAGGGN